MKSENNLRNQISNCTMYDRYPNIFSAVKNTISYNNPRILCFGCSSGEEVFTLAEKYFPCSQIDGIDIDDKIIEIAKSKKSEKNINFYSNIEDIKGRKYDLIFAMSVLCRFPEKGNYCFSIFSTTISLIDSFLIPNGHLVLYNTNYLFEDTKIHEKYESLDLGINDDSFVPKYSSDDKLLYKGYPNVVKASEDINRKMYPYFCFLKKI
jgi:chemotaxis methyl-accepting protein methylase